jgi:hypothetical protein
VCRREEHEICAVTAFACFHMELFRQNSRTKVRCELFLHESWFYLHKRQKPRSKRQRSDPHSPTVPYDPHPQSTKGTYKCCLIFPREGQGGYNHASFKTCDLVNQLSKNYALPPLVTATSSLPLPAVISLRIPWESLSKEASFSNQKLGLYSMPNFLPA